MTSGASDMKHRNNVMDNRRHKYKAILRRTGKFQTYFSEVWQLMSSYAVKAACLRDKNDEIAKCLNNFTKVEEFSTTSKLAMAVAAELVASVGDYQDLAVQRIETLVLPNLSSYGIICDSVKADVLNAIQAIKREQGKKKTLNTLKRKANNANDPKLQKVMDDATREFERASAEATRLSQLSQEHVIKFEHKRLMDLKETFGNFIKIQIATHAKSLELLSQTYKHIQNIDEDADLDILKADLKIEGDKKKNKAAKLKKSKPQKFSSHSSKHRREREHASEESSRSNSDDNSESEYNSDASYSDEIRRLEDTLKPTNKSKNKRSNCSRENLHEKSRHHEKHSKEMAVESSGTEETSQQQHDEHRESKSAHSKGKGQESRGNVRNRESYSRGDYYTPQISKRPSSPSRPITAPTRTRINHHERDNDSSFRNRNVTTANGRMDNNTQKSYYYSQSEDEKSYQLSGQKSNHAYASQMAGAQATIGRRVSFQYSNAERENTEFIQSQYQRDQHPAHFPAGKPAIKRYC